MFYIHVFILEISSILCSLGVVENTSLTSFDANSLVPLLPHPLHLHIIPKDPEPLYTSIKYGKK